MNRRIEPAAEKAIGYFTRKLREALGHDLLAVKLFGSHARGDASPGSDVDAFVLVRERTTWVETVISDIAFETNLAFDVFVAPTVYGESEFHNPIVQETPLLRAIEQEGVLV